MIYCLRNKDVMIALKKIFLRCFMLWPKKHVLFIFIFSFFKL
jgi:hypothetical protein